MTPTNINFTPKKYAGAISLDRSPSPGPQARTGWECFAPLQEKTSGTEVSVRNRHTVGARIPNIRIPNPFENRTFQSSVFEWSKVPFNTE